MEERVELVRRAVADYLAEEGRAAALTVEDLREGLAGLPRAIAWGELRAGKPLYGDEDVRRFAEAVFGELQKYWDVIPSATREQLSVADIEYLLRADAARWLRKIRDIIARVRNLRRSVAEHKALVMRQRREFSKADEDYLRALRQAKTNWRAGQKWIERAEDNFRRAQRRLNDASHRLGEEVAKLEQWEAWFREIGGEEEDLDKIRLP